jgi:hypothetical protein
VTDSESGNRYLTWNQFLGETGLSPEAFETWGKNGWVKPDKGSDGEDRYSQASVEFVKTMLYFRDENGVNLTQAYQMAVKATNLKKRRNELPAARNEGDGKALKFMDPKKLKTYTTFENALTIDRQLLEDITIDMSHNGYRPSEPIALCHWEGLEGEVVHDGHTRRLAAIAAGIEKVPVSTEKFADEMAALEDFVKRQLKRRKNDAWVRYQMIIAVDSLMDRGGDRRSEDAKSKTPGGVIETKGITSSERTAKMVGCGPRTVDRVRKIRKAGTPEILEALKNRKMTITEAEEAIDGKAKDKKRTKKAELKEIRKAAEKLLNEDNLAGIDSLGGDLAYHANKAVEEYLANKLEQKPYRIG